MTKKKVSLPVEGIPNLWIVYNGKAGKSRGKKFVALPSVIWISLL